MQGNVIRDGWRNREVKDALELCLSCKACKSECPVNVDMATWKAEFLAHYYEGRIHPLHHYAFGFMDRWARLASVAPSLANLPGRTPGIDSLIKSVLGVAPQRNLPQFAAKSFRDQFNRANRSAAGGQPVLLWPDTWNNYFHPQALSAAAKLLTAAGTSVQIPQRHACCGRPLYDFGFLDQARSYLLRILDQFEPQISAGIPVVMLEPSCASVFRDELVNFFPHDERAIRLSRQTVMLSEILAQRAANWQAPQLPGRRIIVHGHCHQKSIICVPPAPRWSCLTPAAAAWLGPLDSNATSSRYRKRWPNACFCLLCALPANATCWSATASAAASRSARIRRAPPCTWPRFSRETADACTTKEQV
jgi:Fe-S oxidoreductase